MTGPKILLVDDTDEFRSMMQMSLENNVFEVVSVASVTEALNQIVTQHFDVLITDLHMPEPGDGFAVVTAMRHAHPCEFAQNSRTSSAIGKMPNCY